MKVFISYSHRDGARARGVGRYLDEHGLEVFIDDRLRIGEEFPVRLEREIDDADAVLVLWTFNGRRSAWVAREARRARDQGKLRPVRFGVPPPDEFESIHAPELSLHASPAAIAAAAALVDPPDGVRPSLLEQSAPRPPSSWADRPGQASGWFRRFLDPLAGRPPPDA